MNMASAPHMIGLSDKQFEEIVSRAWAATFDDAPIQLIVPARIRASVLAPQIRIDRPSTPKLRRGFHVENCRIS